MQKYNTKLQIGDISTENGIVPSKVMCSLITPSTTRACVFWRYWRSNSYEYCK
jgi:hypothetical protein